MTLTDALRHDCRADWRLWLSWPTELHGFTFPFMWPPSAPWQVVIHSLADAHEEIDKAISSAVFHSKPVYICVCCNLAGEVEVAVPHVELTACQFCKPVLLYMMQTESACAAAWQAGCRRRWLRFAVTVPAGPDAAAAWQRDGQCSCDYKPPLRPPAAGLHHPSFDSSPIPYSLSTKQSNPRSLEVRGQGGCRWAQLYALFGCLAA